MSELNRAVRIRVSGRVQGVGFRYSTMIQARALDISGWVRNHDDGSVEVFAQGTEHAIEVLTRFLGVGPAGAEVASISVDPDVAPIDADSFEIR